MLESTIEKALVKHIKSKGGVARKFSSPSQRGVPDRIVLLPGGVIKFVELKAPGKEASPLQKLEHRLLRRLGFTVYILDSIEGIHQCFP